MIAEPDSARRRPAAVEAAGLSAPTRRDALRPAALGAGALAAAGLLRPAQRRPDQRRRPARLPRRGDRARADRRARLLDRRRRQARRATLKTTFERFRDQEQAHANALRSALDSLGFDPPDAPDSPTDTGVFDDVDGLSDDAANQLTDLLGKLAGLKTDDQFLDYLATSRRSELASTRATAPALDSEDLATTSAEIAGCQAQHLVVLGERAGDPPEALAPRPRPRARAGRPPAPRALGRRRRPRMPMSHVTDALEPRPASASRSELSAGWGSRTPTPPASSTAAS